MPARRPLLLALVALSVLPNLACAGAYQADHMDLPLAFRPTDDVHEVPLEVFQAFHGQRIQVQPFRDMRPDKAAIGMNREDGARRPVVTSDDVGAFVGAEVAGVLLANGVSTVASGGTRVLSGDLLQFFVSEDNTYNAVVAARLTLTDASGHVLWEGPMAGRSKRFGRSFSADNYEESYSNALLDGLRRVLATPEFLQAVRGARLQPI